MVNISEKVCKDLSKARMNASDYKRKPFRGAGFIIATDKGKEVKLYADDDVADIEYSIDKKHKQAILNVEEEPRVISGESNVFIPVGRFSSFSSYSPSQVKEEITHLCRSTIRFSVPNSKLRINLEKDQLAEITNIIRKGANQNVYIEWELKVGKTTNNLLCGIDETAHFICALPKKAESVEHAHEILRPKKVSEGSLRQGEWFFVPVTNKNLIKKLNSAYAYYEELEDDSSHNAIIVNYERSKYAIGAVVDSRQGRHKNLILPTWHKVVRNTEIAPVLGEKAKYWD